MTAYWPTVRARLVTLLPTLLDDAVVVFDGPSAGREKGAHQYVTVGASLESGSGTYEQPDSPISGNVREERGEVVCEFVDWSGDLDAPTRLLAVFANADLLEHAVRADQTLGVLPAGSTTSLAGDPIVTPTAARLVVTVAYFIPVSA